ncbi:nucleotidyltransferase family protein [Streptosporangium saharense]|uniref:hypothetical protein n=1 Tax=Streptosporangium saharense TaxID=1706840 RepID=UPI0036A11AD7
MSKGALDRLGKSLVSNGRVAPEDAEAFASVAEAYQDALAQAERYLFGLGFRVSTRVKTTQVLIEKLCRESSRLSQVQDLAGARIVVQDRMDQDKALESIRGFFDAHAPKPCKAKDRRADPSHGYRAVHLIVFLEDIPVEIQIRTQLQDVWAQIMERLADHWGRGIRYGDLPEAPDALVRVGLDSVPRRKVLEELGVLSGAIDNLERHRLRFLAMESQCAQVSTHIDGLRGFSLDRLAVPDDLLLRVHALREVFVTRGGESVRLSPMPALSNLMEVWTFVEEVLEASRAEVREAQETADRLEELVRRTLEMFAQAADEMSVGS